MKKIISLILALTLSLPLAYANDQTVNDAAKESVLLLQLKQKLAQAEYRYYLLQNNVKNAQSNLEETREEIQSLEETINGLDKSINQTEKDIKSVKTQIETKKMEIKRNEKDIQILALQYEDQKAIVSDLMTLLYIKRGVFYENDEVNAVKVLASADSVSETLQKVTYLDLIEAQNADQIAILQKMDEDLKTEWTNLRKKQDELKKLDEELQGQKNNLDAQREGKQRLLDETKGDEALYSSMILGSGDREEQILHEIEIYRSNVLQMEAKFNGTRAALTDDQKAEIDKIAEEAMQNFEPKEAAKDIDLDWPVSPSRGITALFHDSAYQAVFGVDHYAVDIRANHGTPITAPADGVVYSVVWDPNSTAYAYIIIAHRMGVMTLYGHISEPAVSPGDFVQRSQIIGSTGATPGTVGAGYRTTGPHLHFEIWQDGVKVDPLNYMPLEEVPADSLPEQYLRQMKEELENQIKDIENQLNS